MSLVRICHSRPPSWLWWLVFCACFLQSTSLPVSNQNEPSDEDKRCFSTFGSKYVYEEVQGVCVPCRTCECGYIATNPHCVKCVDFGILNCQTTALVTSTPQQERKETSQSPQTSMETTIEPTSTGSTTVMATTLPTTTAETNEGNSTWEIVVGVSVGGTILGIAVLYAVLKCCRCKKAPGGTQETQPPEETHPMTGRPQESSV
ncbi:uncharacterized protein LOC119734252 isoform X2 [Patiria miniata]|uniref:TNFR-Cys domain-containing protein n=1 Tax=Patiria miniata TaxID=46514 RepID=A0A914AJ26_PATMI|nr:uncharacterized protein LOC119734252 isoform X2 [Patiria miniata]